MITFLTTANVILNKKYQNLWNWFHINVNFFLTSNSLVSNSFCRGIYFFLTQNTNRKIFLTNFLKPIWREHLAKDFERKKFCFYIVFHFLDLLFWSKHLKFEFKYSLKVNFIENLLMCWNEKFYQDFKKKNILHSKACNHFVIYCRYCLRIQYPIWKL